MKDNGIDACRIVRIRHAYDMKSRPIRECEVNCTAADLIFVSNIIPAYISYVDGFRSNDIQYIAYYRNRFLSIAGSLSEAQDPSVTEISCAYGSLVLVICMLRDEKLWAGTGHAGDKDFRRIADSLSAQIGYDYDAAAEKCRKKAEKEEADSDVGGEAMALMVKKSRREAEYRRKQNEESQKNKKST